MTELLALRDAGNFAIQRDRSKKMLEEIDLFRLVGLRAFVKVTFFRARGSPRVP